MANPFFKAMGGGQMPGPMGQFQRLMQQFNQFRANFQGDPKAVEKLLQSGKMSQQQLNQLQAMAKQFENFLR